MEPLPIKPRILIVDDHPANLLAFELVLEKEFSAVLAESGQQALEFTERSEFAVILLDVRMPLMDGYATAVELRRRERTRFTPILFTSAIERAPADILRDLSGIDYVLTPVDPDFLRFKVASLAQSHLENRTLQFQLDQVAGRMRQLQSSMATSGRIDRALEHEIRQLERMSDDLKRRSGTLVQTSPGRSSITRQYEATSANTHDT